MMTPGEKVERGINMVAEGLSEIWTGVWAQMVEGAKALASACVDTMEGYEMAKAYMNEDISDKVYHLYRHGRKARTKKKQVSRMKRQVRRNGRLEEKCGRRASNAGRGH